MCTQPAALAETVQPRFPAVPVHIMVAAAAQDTAAAAADALAERFAERLPAIPPVGRAQGKAASALAETVPLVAMALTDAF